MTTFAGPACTVCQATGLQSSLSFGAQPPSNRFLSPSTADGAEETFSLSVGYCRSCQTIQLVDRMPVEAIRPRHDWIAYNEPEGHLDEVAHTIVELPGLNGASRVLGMTYKDKSTLDRLGRLGIPNGACLTGTDFGAIARPFGLETIQALLSDEAMVARLRSKYGRADVVVARHMVEHATSASQLIKALRGLVAPRGYLILEVPDSERFIRLGNHAFVWEEHLSYFTGESMHRLADEAGAEITWFGRFPYPYEDSLNVALRFDPVAGTRDTSYSRESRGPAAVLERFAESLVESRVEWRKRLKVHSRRGKIAVFGAGHLASKFINFLELGNLIDCVIDDHPKKAGLLMPGSRLPIVPSSALADRHITMCVSTLNPESEAKVRQKLTWFFDGGGVFEPASVTAR